LRIDDITDLKLVGQTSPHVRIAATIAAVTPNTTGSDETRPTRDEPSDRTTSDPSTCDEPLAASGGAVPGDAPLSDPTASLVVVTSTSLKRIVDYVVGPAAPIARPRISR
jgi:hypothetical protein